MVNVANSACEPQYSPLVVHKEGSLLLLSIIIPSNKKVKNLLVYMAPLIDELQELWKGVKVIEKK